MMRINELIIERIRNEVIYRKFNLMDEVFPFKKKFHVIFCRNVMIYFDNKTKIDLLRKFYDWTENSKRKNTNITILLLEKCITHE